MKILPPQRGLKKVEEGGKTDSFPTYFPDYCHFLVALLRQIGIPYFLLLSFSSYFILWVLNLQGLPSFGIATEYTGFT